MGANFGLEKNQNKTKTQKEYRILEFQQLDIDPSRCKKTFPCRSFIKSESSGIPEPVLMS